MDKDKLQLRRQIDQLFSMIEETQKLAQTTARAQDTRHTAIMPGETVQILDADGNVAAYFGGSNESGQLIEHVAGPEPKQPSEPELDSSMPGALTVIADGLDAEGEPAQGNHARVLIHTSHVEFTPDESTVTSSFIGPEGRQDVVVEPGEWYVAIQWRTQSGQLSEPSELAFIEVEQLVDSADIQAALDEAQTRLDEAKADFEKGNDDRKAEITNLNDVVLPGLKAALEASQEDLERAFSDMADRQQDFDDSMGEAVERIANAEAAFGPIQEDVAEARTSARESREAAEAAEARAVEANNRAMTRLANGNFEQGLDYWLFDNASLQDADPNSGSGYVAINADGWIRPQSAFPVTEGQVWELSLHAKAQGGQMHATFGSVADNVFTPFEEHTITPTIGWSSFGALRTTIPAGVDMLSFEVRAGSTGSNRRVDDVALRDVTDVVRLEEAAKSAADKADAAQEKADSVELALGGKADASLLPVLEERLTEAFGEADEAVSVAAAQDAKAKADAAQGAAEAKADELAKAEAKAAQSAAEATAAQDALTKANAAREAAESAASTDATAKADAAKAAAEAAAAADAKAKADAAQAEAIRQAALDATAKADAAKTAAENAAKQYADQQDVKLKGEAAADAQLKADEAIRQAQEALDNLEVGSRNLLTNSGGDFLDPQGLAYSSTIVEEDGRKALAFNSSNNIIYLGNRSTADFFAGDTLTFSFWAKASKPMGLGRVYMGSGWGPRGLDGQMLTEEWTRYSFTHTLANNFSPRIHMYPEILNDDGTHETFFVTDWKLERGNKATDWTPAPEDLQAQVEAAQAEAERVAKEYTDEQGVAIKSEAAEDAKAKADEALRQAQEALDNLEIGSRNYFLGSHPGPPFSYSSNNSREYPVQTGLEDGVFWLSGFEHERPDYLYISSYVAQTWEVGRGSAYSDNFFPLPEHFTQSVEVMCYEPITIRMGSDLDSRTTLEPGVWTRLTSTMPLTGTRPSGVSVQESDAPVGTRVYMRHWKLEKGHKATDWAPAPEDFQAQIDAAKQSAADAHEAAGEAHAHADAAMTRAGEAESTAIAEAKRLAKDAKDRAEEAIAKGKVIDTRHDNQDPQWYWTNYSRDSVTEFKRRNTMEIDGSGAYIYVTTVVPWSDNSGGAIIQTATIGDVVMSRESIGRGDDAVWGEWVDPVAEAKDLAENLPKVLHGTSAPSGTAPDGSIWWQHSGSLRGAVTAQWNRVNGQWVSTPISSEAIANLDVGKLTAGSADIADAVIEKLYADVVAANKAEIEELIAHDLIADNADIISAAIKNLNVTEQSNFNDAFADKLQANEFTARVANLARANIAARNLYPDPNFEDTAQYGSTWTVVSGGIEKNGGNSQQGTYYTAETIPATPGDKFRISADITWLSGSAGTVSVYARSYNASGSYIGGSATSSIRINHSDRGYNEGIYTVPDNAASITIGFFTESDMSTGARVRIESPRIQNMLDGNLLVQNSVGAREVNAESIFTDKAVANTVWSEVVRTGLLTAEEALIGGALLEKDSITVDKLTGLSEILTALLRAKKIEADDIKVNELWADKAWLSAVEAASVRLRSVINDWQTILSGRGMEVISPEGQPTVQLGNYEETGLTLYSDGEATASMTDDGHVSGTIVSANDEFYYQGTELTEYLSLDEMARGAIAYGERNMSGREYKNFTHLGFLEVSYDALANRSYLLMVEPYRVIDAGFQRIVVTFDGSDPLMNMDTTTSTRQVFTTRIPDEVGGGVFRITPVKTDSLVRVFIGVYSGTAGFRFPGVTGNVSMTILDQGMAPENTGVNRADSITGGSHSPDPKPPVTKTRRTRTWSMSWWRTWWQNGNIPGSGVGVKEAAQGRSPYFTTAGTYRSMIGFPSMTSTLSGADIEKIEVRVRVTHSHSGSGGRVRLGTHNRTSRPSVYTGQSNAESTNTHFGRGQEKWITLPSSLYNGFRNGTYRGVTMFTSSTSSTYYVQARPDRFAIRVTYRK